MLPPPPKKCSLEILPSPPYAGVGAKDRELDERRQTQRQRRYNIPWLEQQRRRRRRRRPESPPSEVTLQFAPIKFTTGRRRQRLAREDGGGGGHCCQSGGLIDWNRRRCFPALRSPREEVVRPSGHHQFRQKSGKILVLVGKKCARCAKREKEEDDDGEEAVVHHFT